MSHAPIHQEWMESPAAGGISAGRAMGWLFSISGLLWPRPRLAGAAALIADHLRKADA